MTPAADTKLIISDFMGRAFGPERGWRRHPAPRRPHAGFTATSAWA